MSAVLSFATYDYTEGRADHDLEPIVSAGEVLRNTSRLVREIRHG